MDQAPLVEMQIQNGQRLIDRLVGEGVAVAAAGWVKECEGDQWYLYLATSLVGEDGATKAAYRRMNDVIREMQKEGIWFEPLDVKVIGPDDPTATAMMAERGMRPRRTPMWFRGSRLGELAVEAAYLYPPTGSPEVATGVSKP